MICSRNKYRSVFATYFLQSTRFEYSSVTCKIFELLDIFSKYVSLYICIYVALQHSNKYLAVGPALSGTLVNSIGFEWMLFGIAILNFMYAPLMFFLRAPPSKEEKKVKLACTWRKIFLRI